MKPALYILLVFFCVFGFGPISTAVTSKTNGRGSGQDKAHAVEPARPTQCVRGKTLPEALTWRWSQGTTVSIYYLNGHFSAAETGTFAEAIANWNHALNEMDSGIEFVVAGERADDNVTHGASIVFTRGTPRGRDRLGEIKLKSIANGAVHLLAIVKPVVTDLDALKSLMAHELGHSMGLADCYGCKRGTTAMAAFKEKNEGTNVFAPSECDKYVVASSLRRSPDSQARSNQPKFDSAGSPTRMGPTVP